VCEKQSGELGAREGVCGEDAFQPFGRPTARQLFREEEDGTSPVIYLIGGRQVDRGRRRLPDP
jgi:hypothetical protein